MSPTLRSWLARAGGLALGALLLWLALRGVDAAALGAAIEQADLRWLVPIVVVALLSHLVRAWRWRILLAALPETQPGADGAPPAARVPTLWEAFAAVMMGYAVNYAIPRAGEVVRTATIARRTGADGSAVLGTVVLDRLLDVAMLAAGLATLPLVLHDRIAPLWAMFGAPALARVGGAGRLALVALVAGVVLGGAVWLWRARQARLAAAAPGADATDAAPSRLAGLVDSFRGGLATLGRSPRRGALVGATLAMWGLYALMAYLPFLLLGQAAPYDLSLLDGWAIMLLGSIGMVVPSPGGAGSFHYVTIETLTRLWGVARTDAAAYAVLAHGAQLVVYAITGAACFGLLGWTRRNGGPLAQPGREVMRTDAADAANEASTAPANV